MQYMLVNLFATITLIFTLVLIYYKWAFYYWKRKGVEQVTPSFPFGNISKLVRGKLHFGQLIKDIYEKYKLQHLPYIGIYLFTSPSLVILDLKIIKAILTTDFEHFTDHGSYVNEEHEPLTGSLFALTGEKWKSLRIKLTPTFTSGKIKMMLNTLLGCSENLKDVMEDIVKQKEPVEIKELVARFTTDVIGSCAFGIDCNSLKDPNSEFRQYGKKVFDSSFYQLFVRVMGLLSPRILNILGLTLYSKDLTHFMTNVVRDTVQYRESNNIKRNDFMHLLIQLKNNVSIKGDKNSKILKNHSKAIESFTIGQMTAQAFVFFLAGFETSSTLLTFCLFELVINQSYQENLRAEIKSVLQKHHNKVTYEALSEMSYMDMCIHETLRKYPPVPALLRQCTKRYRFPNSTVTIEKGTQIYLPVLAVHWDPTYYPNPEIFDPARFNAENKSSRDHFAWLPFGEGPRACIGIRFGMMETKVALTTLLNNYKFTLNAKTNTPLAMCEAKLILEAKGGVWLDAQKI